MLWASGFPFVQIVPPPLEWEGGQGEHTGTEDLAKRQVGWDKCSDGEVDRFQGWYEMIRPSQALELSGGSVGVSGTLVPITLGPRFNHSLANAWEGEGGTLVQPILKVSFNIPVSCYFLWDVFNLIPSCVYPKELI